MKKWMYVLLSVALFFSLTMPVWADDGEGQAVLPGESVVIGPGEEVQGGLTVMGGTVELQEGGRVNGDVAVLGGNAIIDGEVDGSLVVLGGTAELGAHALVRRDLFTLGASVSRAPGATVQGETIEGFRGRIRLPALPSVPSIRNWRTTGDEWDERPFVNLLSGFLRFVLNLVAMVVLGVLLVLFLPKQTAQVGQTVSEAGWTSLAFGVLSFLVLIVLVPLLVIICIGIPVALLLIMAAVAAGIFGWIAIGVLLGKRLLTALHASQQQPVIEVVIGVTALTLLAEVPCLGWLAGIIAGAIGLGAVVLTRFGTTRYPPLQTATALPASPADPGAPTTPAS